MASIHHNFARKQVGDTQKGRKPEVRSSCKNSLDWHWSAWPWPSRESPCVPRLRYMSVSRPFNEYCIAGKFRQEFNFVAFVKAIFWLLKLKSWLIFFHKTERQKSKRATTDVWRKWIPDELPDGRFWRNFSLTKISCCTVDAICCWFTYSLVDLQFGNALIDILNIKSKRGENDGVAMKRFARWASNSFSLRTDFSSETDDAQRTKRLSQSLSCLLSLSWSSTSTPPLPKKKCDTIYET